MGKVGPGINPTPPELNEAAGDWKTNELLWITKNDMRMSGMPAWGVTFSDDDIWTITAFARKLPTMTQRIPGVEQSEAFDEGEVALVDLPTFRRIPRHVAFIPDGNRRWAQNRGLRKEESYASGLEPGFQLYDICRALGIEELTVYGFTSDNTKRPPEQTAAFQQACVDAVEGLSKLDASLLVVGNDDSPLFPPELKPYRTRQVLGNGTLKVNFLVNYDWHWDLSKAAIDVSGTTSGMRRSFMERIGSSEVSRIDLVVRWGGRRRLSGLLPVQAVYADFYIIDDLWPDFKPEHFFNALRWYESQDVTLGG